MSPLTLKKSRASKGSVSKVSLDRRKQERMCSGDALATPHFAQTLKNFVTLDKGATPQSGCPSRIKAIHVVNAPSPFSAVFKILFPFLPKKIQDRVFLHPNDNWKSLHSAIPPEVLPEEYGGKLTFDSCINVLENIEEVDDQFRNMFKYGYIKTKADRQSFRPICL
ncbi:hypothetical protein AVEN_171190-1 [Araneus ventricosus]|uniref:CRAL-TRIO domain-containing protein n=1 Tax=Araneus ventricosus TaxID=182803 RepID=A0A4Y2JCX6_ARAVE|nr:hypothetical protein AVEN_171190-1 [Araneus ventricosus]